MYFHRLLPQAVDNCLINLRSQLAIIFGKRRVAFFTLMKCNGKLTYFPLSALIYVLKILFNVKQKSPGSILQA